MPRELSIFIAVEDVERRITGYRSESSLSDGKARVHYKTFPSYFRHMIRVAKVSKEFKRGDSGTTVLLVRQAQILNSTETNTPNASISPFVFGHNILNEKSFLIISK